MMVLAGARVVSDGRIIDGWVGIDGDRIVAVEAGPAPAGEQRVELDGAWLVPGFIDLHVHGGGGAWIGGDGEGVARVVDFHRRHGTARMVGSIVSAPVDEMAATVAAIAAEVETGGGRHLAGSHLEGPFLDTAHCGALDPSSFLEADGDTLERLLAAGRGTVRVVTVSPGLPGGAALVRRAVDAGAVAAIGHSGAGYDEAAAAVDAGATLATHTFNAMAPWHHRAPGIAGVVLDRDEVVCEVIADGFHLHEAVLRMVFAVKGPGGVALVTDAIAAAGCDDGTYRLGRRLVRVAGGRAEVEGTGRLAGSVLTMDAAVRNAVGAGVPLPSAIAAATATPARVLGIAGEAGAVAPGYCADLVVLDRDLQVSAVLMDGTPE